MPFKSEAQRSWAHTPAGTKALGGAKKVEEWDKASKGLALPKRKGRTQKQKAQDMLRRGMQGKPR